MKNRTSNKESRSKSGVCIIIALVLVFTLPFVLYYVLRAAGAYLIVASNLEASNAIVVLSGGEETRMTEALRLYNEEYANKIILTETGQKLEGYKQLYSFDMRIVLLSNGVPSGNILVTEKVVSNTRDEALAVKKLMSSQQMVSAIIVTDPYHTRRAYGIFLDVFQDSGIKLMIHPTSNSWYYSRTWFLKAEGWRFTVLEYLKLIADKLNISVP